jgi:hypothetical protein
MSRLLRLSNHWIIGIAIAVFACTAVAVAAGSTSWGGVLGRSTRGRAARLAAPEGSNPRGQTTVPLPERPSDEEILRIGLFAEPLVPVKATEADENRELARALTAYQLAARSVQHRDHVEALTAFLRARPTSAWRPALLLNLGTIYRQTGHFSRALATWQEAWDASRSLSTPHGQAIGDAAAAALSQFQAYLGRKETLAPLLAEIAPRPLRGTAAELVVESRHGLADMLERPERSFRCGPLALEQIVLRTGSPTSGKVLEVLDEAPSTPEGLSLRAVRDVSVAAGLNYQMAFRAPGAAVVVPAVVHWKVGHYAALVEVRDGQYQVEDATFGDSVWMSPATLDEEASGYFLVPPGSLPSGHRAVHEDEAERVWGRGDTGANKDKARPDQARLLPSRTTDATDARPGTQRP